MAAFCLLPEYVDKFKAGLRSGEIDPAKLSDMSSQERHGFLEKYVGKETALNVNALFESKLLLKNQQAGMINWAKKVAGLSPQAKRDLISKIEKLDKVLNPSDQAKFLKDLATTKLGADVTPEEAKKIFDLSNQVKEARTLQQLDGTFKTEDDRMNFGRAKVNLINYVNDLRNASAKKSFNPVNAASYVAGTAKAIKASLDNSALFRQGWKSLLTHPLTWQKNARKSFLDIAKTFGGKEVMNEVNADILSRPNYDLMNKAKLAVGKPEEAFPTSIAEKVPLLGRVYKASETAYTAFLYRTRADIFDQYIKIAKDSGVDLGNRKELEAIGSMVNSLTGRGNLGKLEGSGADLLNNVFFSPRNVKSQIDTLGHVITGAGGSNFVRKQAAINLVKIIAGTAGIITVANAVRPHSVDTDPRSSDFGKIKVGDTRFDITGGMGSLMTLASRLATNSSKSSTTGIVSELNSGNYGSQTSKDVVQNFLENKLSPAASVVKDLLAGKDFNGNKPTVAGETKNLLVPLPITTYQELKNDPNSANILLSMIADGLGIATNTYGKVQKDWSQNPTKTQQAFMDHVGQDRFNQANKDFNDDYNRWFANFSKTDTYKNLDDAGKQQLITEKRANLQDTVFKEYGFVYKQDKKTVQEKAQSKQIKRLAK